MDAKKHTSIWPFFAILFLCLQEVSLQEVDSSAEDESAMKCDSCKIIAKRFSYSFNKAQEESGGKRLNEDDFIEAAEGTCDEDWSGYGVRKVDAVLRLAGKDSEVGESEGVEVDSIWDRRLQDFCDELLSEAPDEKTLYSHWLGLEAQSLEDYLCRGSSEMFSACLPGASFGAWPGDEFEDYDDEDFHFEHDEF